MDIFTLFAANVIVVLGMALVLMLVGRARSEPYWRTWGLANVVIAVALLIYMYGYQLPETLRGALPNGLLVLGIGMRWHAARQFESRPTPKGLFLLPMAVFLVVSALPLASGNYRTFYLIANITQAAVAAACAYEFWRGDTYRSLSRQGIVLAYACLSATFIARILQGLIVGEGLARNPEVDPILTVQLVVGVGHFIASGAFALTLAFERDARALCHLASRDALTGLLNRAAFESRIRTYFKHHKNEPYGFALLDLDHFKRINDKHGHAVGDLTLQACAETFTEILGENTIVARWGGEEFVVFLPGLSSGETLFAVETLRARVARIKVQTGNGTISPSISAGLCHSSTCPTRDLKTLLSNADRGLYAAKARGRNRVEQIASVAA